MSMTAQKIAQAVDQRAAALLWLVLAAWAAFMLIIKFRLAHYGLATDDIYNYANALYNTNFWDKWLYVARYETGRDMPSLVFDHWQPTTLVLWPFVLLFGPHSLLVVQALAPVWAAYWLSRISQLQGLGGFDRLILTGICLFSPYMMLAVMDSIEGFHATALLLIFGAPLAWAAVMRRWGLALVLLLVFLNVRENAALHILGAAVGYWIFRNDYFDSTRRSFMALILAGIVFWIGVKGAPMLANISNFHFSKVGHAVGMSELLKLNFTSIDKDWIAYLLGLWPALFAPGALMTVVPESIVLLVAGKKIVNWYGMLLVFAGALAAVFGLAWLRRRFSGRAAHAALGLILILHLALLMVTSTRNVLNKSEAMIEKYGFHIPMESLILARQAVDTACRISIFFQAMKGFGDLPYLQYPHPTQAEWARFIVVSKRGDLNLLHNRLQQEFVTNISKELVLRFEDKFLAVYERPTMPCVKEAKPRTRPG
ncbi:MAG: hypothetical protein RIA64_12610 [Rhodospirillales bacterium]